jgi:hypothetical protein
MIPQLNERYSQLYGWAGLAAAVLIYLGLSWETTLHRFNVGLQISLIILIVLLALFEGVWRAVANALLRLGVEIS